VGFCFLQVCTWAVLVVLVVVGVTATSALAALRQMLAVLKVSRASEHRTHDLRRGHAKDLQMSGWHRGDMVAGWAPRACCARRPTVGDIGSRGMAEPRVPNVHGPPQA
jgi:hypothetical protein